MKAILQTETGGPEVLHYTDRDLPVPAPDEILVEIASISVNFADVMMRRGSYPIMPTLPFVPGLEASGVVAGLGEDIEGLEIGQRVVVLHPGCYAEFVAADARYVFPVPDDVDFDAAAALPVNYLTAWHMLHTMARTSPGESVLMKGAAGGVGTAVAQLGRLAGLRLLGTASTTEKADFARSQGYQQVVLHPDENVAQHARDFTAGTGIDLVLDPVAGRAFVQDFELVAPFGQIVWFGMAAGMPEANLINLLLDNAPKSPRVGFFSLYSVAPPLLASSLEILFDHLRRGEVSPHIHTTLPLADAGAAQQMLEDRKVMGKVILRP